jgi:D-sedoheptulose 7-phosphate isomerase
MLAAWKNGFEDATQCLKEFTSNSANLERCDQFSQMMVETIKGGGNIFTCGNGGSHCDSMHFAEELTGRYRKNRRPLGALALGDPSHTTCTANDFGFDHIFARQLEGLGRKGDLLIGFSTSGNSKNVILAFEVAKKIGMKRVALLGRGGGILKDVADLSVIVPGKTADRVQEMHIKLVHLSIEAMERQIFPENYE